MDATLGMLSATKHEEPQKDQNNTEEFVYLPPEPKKPIIHDEDLTLNDPLT